MNPQPIPPTRIAAFCDLDGTLIAEPSLEKRLFDALRQSGAIPFRNYARWAFKALRLLPQGISKIQQSNKSYLSGVKRDLLFLHLGEIPIFDEAIARLAWHARQQHELFLVTGTLEPLARIAATALECELEARGLETQIRICATRLEEEYGRWTGRLIGEARCGEAKRKAVLDCARQCCIDLRNSHAYGNTVLDSFMLSVVGHAHVVNPSKQLATLANLYDWPVWHWHHEKNLSSQAIPVPETKIQQLESSV